MLAHLLVKCSSENNYSGIVASCGLAGGSDLPELFCHSYYEMSDCKG